MTQNVSLMGDNNTKTISNTPPDTLDEQFSILDAPTEPVHLEPLSSLDKASKEELLIADSYFSNEIIAEIWAKRRMEFSLNIAKEVISNKKNINGFTYDFDGFLEKNPSFVQSVSESIGHDTNTTKGFLSETAETFKRIKQKIHSTKGSPRERLHSAVSQVTDEFNDEIISLFEEDTGKSEEQQSHSERLGKRAATSFVNSVESIKRARSI